MFQRLMLTSCALALSAGAASAEYTLHILHINDLHSRIEPVSASGSTCSAESNAAGECFGGVARLKTMIDQLRAELEGENVILLDAGDQYQGSLMYTTYKGDVEAEFMNLIGFDVMAVGNHEFDDGDEGLRKLVDLVDFPVISGNIDVSQSNVLAGEVQNHVVLEVGGERIGIISALATDTPETASPSDAVIFTPVNESLAADVAALTDEGVTKIIALNHIGATHDIAAAEAVEGLDIIVGGHSHTLFSNTHEAPYAYPHVVNDTPIVQAGAYSLYVGHLTVVFDDAGNVTSATGDTILLDASVAEDEAVVARVAELAGPIEELKNRVVGEIPEMLVGDRAVCRAEECTGGNAIADAMLARVADQGVQIALMNSGGIRADIDAGEVTMGEVLTVLPFQNSLSTFQITGQQLHDALENAASQYEEGAGRFLQVSGMTYTADITKEVGSRITEVTVGGEPLDLAATYGAVSNDYVRNGGDGFAMFIDAANAYDFGPDLADVLVEYLAANAPYQPYLDGRITVIK